MKNGSRVLVVALTLWLAVFAGMIGVTFFGIFLTPVFFSVVMKFFARVPKKKQTSSIEAAREVLRDL